jgi:hypothetical protein
MIDHPLLLSVTAVDLLTLVFLTASLFAVFPVSVRWQPGSASGAQLALERRVEMGAFAAHIAAVCLLLSTLLLVAAVALSLPRTIPGAMCGTGVLQALGAPGGRALGFRFLALLCLSVWQLLEGLNGSRPEASLTETGVRVLLASSPAALLAVAETQRALWGLDFGIPVDCCAVVYDPVAGSGGSPIGAGAAAPVWAGVFLVLSVVLAAAAKAMRRKPLRRFTVWMTAAATLLWVPVGAVTLIHFFSSAIFGVLAHPCPWCLFLPEHGMVGFFQFGALAVAAREGLLAPVALWASGDEDIAPAAAARLRKAGGRILAAEAAFLLVAAGPTLLWRLQHGVWISG